MTKPTGREFKRLRELVAEEKKAYIKPKPGVHRLSSEFHLVLAEAAGNPVMKEILERISAELNRDSPAGLDS